MNNKNTARRSPKDPAKEGLRGVSSTLHVGMKIKVYNMEAKQVSETDVPKAIADASWNSDLVHQVAVSLLANKRRGTAHSKGRGDVRGGGKKPWRQKGTGRARHGSIRSPIWRGGGVVHGPTNERDYSKKINKKMRRKALQAVLAKKIADNEIVVFDNMTFKEIKTKEAASFLKKLENASLMKPRKTKTVLLEKPRGNVALSFRNIPSIKVLDARNFNTLDALESKYVLLTEKLFHGLV